MINFIKTVIIFTVFFLITSCNREKDSFRTISDLKEIKFESPDPFLMSEHIDSIHFVPLNAPYLLGWIPEKIKVTNEHIYFLYTPSPSNCYLIINDRNGNFVTQIASRSNDQQNIVNIRDIDILGNQLFILHDGKISIYETKHFSKIGDDIILQDLYQEFEKLSNGFICYNAINGLHIYSEEGDLIRDDPLMQYYPSNVLDALPHFSKSFDTEDLLFFLSYNPVVYKLNFKEGDLSPAFKINVGKYNITDEERNTLFQAGENSGKIRYKLCRTDMKLCLFNNVYDLKNDILLTMRMNGKTHIGLLNKTDFSGKLFDKVNNDSGLPFLTEYDYFYNFDSYENWIIGALDPEYINLQLADVSEQKIPSNWDEISDKVDAFSNPVVVMYHMKQ